MAQALLRHAALTLKQRNDTVQFTAHEKGIRLTAGTQNLEIPLPSDVPELQSGLKQLLQFGHAIEPDSDLQAMSLAVLSAMLEENLSNTRIATPTEHQHGEQKAPAFVQSELSGLPVLRIHCFNMELATQIDSILQTNPKGLIFDLRGSQGGYLNNTLKVMEQFIPAEKPLYKKAASKQVVQSKGTPNSWPLQPIWVLVDAQTTNVAELFAASLRTYRNATVVGTPTHGMRDIRSVHALPFKNTQLLVLTDQWLMPEETSAPPIKPDVDVLWNADEAQNQQRLTEVMNETQTNESP